MRTRTAPTVSPSLSENQPRCRHVGSYCLKSRAAGCAPFCPTAPRIFEGNQALTYDLEDLGAILIVGKGGHVRIPVAYTRFKLYLANSHKLLAVKSEKLSKITLAFA